MSMGFDRLSTERVDEGLLYTLEDAEAKGHLCMEKHEFVKACLKNSGYACVNSRNGGEPCRQAGFRRTVGVVPGQCV